MDIEKNYEEFEIKTVEDINNLNVNRLDFSEWSSEDIIDYIDYIKYTFEIYFSKENSNIGIYKILSPSNKVYIGQSTNIKNRHEKYKYKSCQDQPALYNAICKYGWDNMIISIEEYFIDCSDISIKLLNLLEILYIKYYNKIGETYNISNGVDSCGKHHPSTIEKLKLSKISIKVDQYDLEGNFIKTFRSINDVVRELHIKSRENIQSCLKSKQKTCYGYIFVHHNQKLNLESKINNNLTKIRQFSKNGEFIKDWNSIKEASLELNISVSGISDCLNNRKKSAGGFYWIRYDDIFDINNFKKLTGKSNVRCILQLTLDNILIKEWSSVKMASEELNISRSAISLCLTGKTNSSAGFKWKYNN